MKIGAQSFHLQSNSKLPHNIQPQTSQVQHLTDSTEMKREMIADRERRSSSAIVDAAWCIRRKRTKAGTITHKKSEG